MTVAGAGVKLAPLLPRGAVQLPAGVPVVTKGDDEFRASQDVLAGMLNLPSGRLDVDDFWWSEPQAQLEVPPGRHPVRATLAVSVAHPSSTATRGAVALVTVMTGARSPIHWRHIGTMGTDGGTGGFASAEIADLMVRDDDESLHDRLMNGLFASRRNGIVEFRLTDDLNIFSFDSGLGDGDYDVYAGTDASGIVTRVVFDSALVRLAWPASSFPSSHNAD